MSMSGVPASERLHIGFFGNRNSGKSSLINALTGQSVSIVSDVPGTTTDPVKKTMELLPLGPVVIIDTPGVDDVGDLGTERVLRTKNVLETCDIAVVVINSEKGITEFDKNIIKQINKREIPYIVCYNKCDLKTPDLKENEICVSAKTGMNIDLLKEKLASFADKKKEKYIIRHMLSKDDVVVLVIPIDSSAPKGRIILPQQQTLREILDLGGVCICVQPEELPQVIEKYDREIKLIITDSQVFGTVSKIVPSYIYLTSFSILMMNYKGELEQSAEAVKVIKQLKDGDKVLIAEGCTHHRQCNDIGTVKLPNLIRKTTGANVEFDFTSGGDFPDDLSQYSLIIHCGGCMLTEQEVKKRMFRANEKGVPITNYGMALAYMNGILERSLKFLRKRR